MVPLCAWCGEQFVAVGRCPYCDAPTPAWRRVPRTAGSLVGRVIAWLLGVACGVACFVVAALVLGRVPRDGWVLDWIVNLFCCLVVVVILVGLGLTFAWQSTAILLLEHDWRHAIDDRRDAVATTRAGRVIRGAGGGRVTGAPFAVTATTLRGVEAFAHYRAVRQVAAGLGVGNLARVDAALAAALLALAGSGRVALRSSRTLWWSRSDERLSRGESFQGVDVRPTDVGPVGVGVELPERSLLDAMTGGGRATVAPTGVMPYRTATATAAPAAEAPWTPLPRVVLAMSGGDLGFRRRLRARLEAEAPSAANLRTAEETGAELAAVLAGLGDRPLAAGLLCEFERGFNLRSPVA